jgi:hypothetical protein
MTICEPILPAQFYLCMSGKRASKQRNLGEHSTSASAVFHSSIVKVHCRSHAPPERQTKISRVPRCTQDPSICIPTEQFLMTTSLSRMLR